MRGSAEGGGFVRIAIFATGFMLAMGFVAAQEGTAPSPVQVRGAEGAAQTDRATLEKALGELEGQLSKSPDDPKLGLARAQCLLDLGRWRESLAKGEALLRAHPDDASIRIMVGEALFVSFRPLDAVEVWRPLLKDETVREEALPRMLSALLAARRFEEARMLLVEAKGEGVPYSDASLRLASEASQDCREKLGYLQELQRRHPASETLSDEIQVAKAVCDAGGTSTRLPAAYPAKVPMWTTDGRALKVQIEGRRKCGIFFDTGTESLRVPLDHKGFENLGIPVIGQIRVAGMGEREEAAVLEVGLVQDLNAGGLHLLHLPAASSRGITGLSPFLGSLVEWDRRKSRFVLWPAGTSPEAILGDGPRLTLPALFIRGVPLVPVTVNGHGPFPFLLDTGADVTILASQYAALVDARINLAETRSGYGTSGGFDMGLTTVSLKLADSSCDLPSVLVARLPQRFPAPVYGILGMDFLARYRMVFDGLRCQVTLSPYKGGGYVEPRLAPRSSSRPPENPMPAPNPTPTVNVPAKWK